MSDIIVLASLGYIGLAYLFKKLPRKVRRFLQNHTVFTDLLTFIMAYLAFGTTFTALLAGVLLGFLTHAMIYISNNPNNFLYIYDLRKKISELVKEVKENIIDFGVEYREGKFDKE